MDEEGREVGGARSATHGHGDVEGKLPPERSKDRRAGGKARVGIPKDCSTTSSTTEPVLMATLLGVRRIV